LADLAGAPAPKNTDGISFAPTLTGQGTQRQHDFFYWEYPFKSGLAQAARMGNWKLVKPPRKPAELYDLKSDESETTNVAADHPDIVKKMTARLVEEHAAPREYPADPNYPKAKDYVR
jgi:arylsulfatase A-like enzyme